MNGLRRIWIIAFLPVSLLLASCAPGRNVFAPACPVPGIVKPLAELARYRNGVPDLGNLIIRARIVDLGGTCKAGSDKNTVDASAQVVIQVVRGPAMEGQTYALPLFVAVTDANAIRDKKEYALTVSFAPNVDSASAVSPEIEMELPVTPEKSAAAYGIVAGFQLTPEEIAANRRNTRR